MAEMIIRNARLVLPEGIVRGELAVEEGRISEIAVSGLPKAEREINEGDKIVMPGVIDAQVHIYDPNHPHRRYFRNESAAAAAGGVTSVVAMPLGAQVLTAELMNRIIGIGEKNSLIDFALHAGIIAEHLQGIPKLASLGIKSFKASTCAPYRMEIFEELLRAVKSVGGVASVHAEDNKILEEQKERLLKQGRKDPLAHAEWCPNETEEKAVKTVVGLAGRMDCNLHLEHLTTHQAVNLVTKGKEMRVPLTSETCPHYLLFTKDDMLKFGPYLKVSPPLKTDKDRAALWDALARGALDIVATDHAPITKEEKEAGKEDIWEAATGIPGIETLLMLMLSEGVAKGRLTLESLVTALSTRTAQIFGLYPRKGVIRKGSDADLVLVDLSRKTKITSEKLHQRAGWTPYEGMVVEGVPVMTISRGVVIAEGGGIVGKPGHGRFQAVR